MFFFIDLEKQIAEIRLRICIKRLSILFWFLIILESLLKSLRIDSLKAGRRYLQNREAVEYNVGSAWELP